MGMRDDLESHNRDSGKADSDETAGLHSSDQDASGGHGVRGLLEANIVSGFEA